MFGKGRTFGKKQPGSSSSPNLLEPEASTRRVVNPVGRGQADVPINEILKSIDRTRREHGKDALINIERFIYEGHAFEAYFFHQGGFDYYLAHIDNPVRWADAATTFQIMHRDDVIPIFQEAVDLFVRSGGDEDPKAMKDYLNRVGALDRQLREAVPDYEERLLKLIEDYYPFRDR